MEDIRTFLKIMQELRRYHDGLGGVGGSIEDCRRRIQKGLQDPKVKFLMEQLEKSGCSIDPNKFIKPDENCHKDLYGIYTPEPGGGVTICCNNSIFQDEVTQTLIHELIHAYDHCRAKNINWLNCYHRACSEIRAVHLSGDCHYVREFFFSRYKGEMRGHEPDCVRRRAAASLRKNKNCEKCGIKVAMEAVWDTCYNDTKPFDKAL